MLVAGAAANGLAVAAGAVAGCLLRKGIPDRISGYLSDGTALVVLYVGISGAVKGENVIAIILSFVLSVLAMTLITENPASHAIGRRMRTRNMSWKVKHITLMNMLTPMLLFIFPLILV